MNPIWNRHARLEYHEAIEHYARIDGKLAGLSAKTGGKLGPPSPPQCVRVAPANSFGGEGWGEGQTAYQLYPSPNLSPH